MKSNFFRFLSGAALLFCSACGVFRFKEPDLNSRLKKFSKNIANSENSKIHYDGVYVNKYEFGPNAKVIYTYLRFFGGGKVYESGIYYDNMPSQRQLADTLSGKWKIYYIKNEILYTQDFNGYNGYFLRKFSFEDNGEAVLYQNATWLNRKPTPDIDINRLYTFTPFQ
jgi:hypothetical protein